jgi:hypothetical protein
MLSSRTPPSIISAPSIVWARSSGYSIFERNLVNGLDVILWNVLISQWYQRGILARSWLFHDDPSINWSRYCTNQASLNNRGCDVDCNRKALLARIHAPFRKHRLRDRNLIHNPRYLYVWVHWYSDSICVLWILIFMVNTSESTERAGRWEVHLWFIKLKKMYVVYL